MDFQISNDDFATTEVTIAPTSDAGRRFFARHLGAGAVSATIPKSKLGFFLTAATLSNLVVA